MKSMTGYGKREGSARGVSVTVEFRSVNHRFCEVVPRVPRHLSGLEDGLKQLVHRHCERGRIEASVSVNATTGRPKAVTLDRTAAREYYQLLKALQRELGMRGTIDVHLLAGMKDVFVTTEPTIRERDIKPLVDRLASGAIRDLNHMRAREGRTLRTDILQRLQRVHRTLLVIERRSPQSVRAQFQRMAQRVAALTGEQVVPTDRLAQELASYADRCDITEELTRLRSHLKQFQADSKAKGAMGRRFDFLLQEMGREINTIGSKANDADIALHVVDVKSELEKIREQVQNIE